MGRTRANEFRKDAVRMHWRAGLRTSTWRMILAWVCRR